MNVALYLRVSTTDQTTLNQEIELKEYCERNGYTLFQIYKDEGISGATTTRPELDKMLKDMRLKRFDAVIVWKLDRLGRSTQHLLQLLEEFKNQNVRLIVTTMGLDTSTAQGKFFFTIIGAVAELERELIRERIKLGLARRKRQGHALGRKKGARDKGMRKRLGYFERWANKKTTVPISTLDAQLKRPAK